MLSSIRSLSLAAVFTLGSVLNAADNPFIGRWALTIPGGGAGWLGVEQKDGALSSSILWGGGSVVPTTSTKLDGDTLIVTRVSKAKKKDGSPGDTVTETISATRAGDVLNLVTSKAKEGGKAMGAPAEFTGKRIADLPPVPDLSKVKFGEPIQLLNGKDLTGWSLIKSADNGWSVVDGVLQNRVVKEKDKHFGNLRTDAEFEDFNLKTEVRTQEGSICPIDSDTYAYHFHEPLGVVGQIIPWNFPILMAVWKLAPALAAGNCVVLKPAEQTPASIMVLIELIADLIPPGVVNIVQGFGVEAGKPLASNKRIAKIAFTGETTTGRLIMQYASQNLIPVTLELGGKSPNIFFADVLDKDDEFFDKALEGFAMFALNQGEVCTCPSRVLVQESIYERFIERALKRVAAIKQGNPLDKSTMIGAQASQEQLEKILSYIDIGKQEGAKVLAGGGREELGGDLATGYYVKPTVFQGNNKMRIFQEEIFGPVVSVTTFKDEEEALAIANDTLYGLGAGLWTRDGTRAFRMGREIQAGRVWTNCYHLYPAHAAFGGYKQSGIGRENHKMMLDHYQQTKNLLVSYSPKALGFF
jgi:aldehyde dehydrogenase